MSSLAFMSFFALAEGRPVMTTCANNTRIWHAHYTTTIQCADGSTLPANVRIYSPMNDVLHADNTIAFVYALAHIPINSIVVMDASHVLPFPGDPQTDSYEDSVPNLPNPFVIALGHVSGNASHLPEGSRMFPILVSEYVRDNTQLCTLTYVRDLNILKPFSPDHYPSATFNSSRPRWKNTNVPFPGAIVQVIGTCSRVCQDATLAIDIENIVLNVPTPDSPTRSTSDAVNDALSAKKRKFSAFASDPKATIQKFVRYFSLPFPCFLKQL